MVRQIARYEQIDLTGQPLRHPQAPSTLPRAKPFFVSYRSNARIFEYQLDGHFLQYRQVRPNGRDVHPCVASLSLRNVMSSIIVRRSGMAA